MDRVPGIHGAVEYNVEPGKKFLCDSFRPSVHLSFTNRDSLLRRTSPGHRLHRRVVYDVGNLRQERAGA